MRLSAALTVPPPPKEATLIGNPAKGMDPPASTMFPTPPQPSIHHPAVSSVFSSPEKSMFVVFFSLIKSLWPCPTHPSP